MAARQTLSSTGRRLSASPPGALKIQQNLDFRTQSPEPESQRAITIIFPVCCYICCKVMGNKWIPHLELLKAEYTEGDALDALGLKRYCCRMLLYYVDLIKKLFNHVPIEN
ncbi:DNA-directed RNA polymerases I, II, and III subunit RPABC5-like [Ochotona curzoniae]|uniref:DNA-directed RNA polymerases I, II, and III subunit RPABC5-like n=1 Tax=Ochotona curzoniae TaxID=130825 RepID=UPI001B353A18|nr:DNA-directed RNA polymerases I, II, and III subunit RPABC5-like [Ochotona curzoniae]